jgi:hypothetical protein
LFDYPCDSFPLLIGSVNKICKRKGKVYYFFMYKKLFFLVVLFSLFTKTVYAGGFNLKSIGQVNTSGQQISHWWYSGITPVLTGDAMAASTVTISIDGVAASVTADESGNWTYNPGSLTAGDHAIILTNNGATDNFTLTLGAENVDWNAVGSGSAETLPAAGVTFPTMTLISIGGIFLLTAKKLVK